MALTRRASMKPSELSSTDHQDGLHDHRKSIYPVGGGRRSSSIHSGHLHSILASRRHGRRGTKVGQTACQILYEPTYRLEPTHKFRNSEVKHIIKETLSDHLDSFQYNAISANLMCRTISDDIKDRVKQLGYDRYKIVAFIVIGESKDNVIISSRCAWETTFDDFATYVYQNKSMFCSAQVFGVYLA